MYEYGTPQQILRTVREHAALTQRELGAAHRRSGCRLLANPRESAARGARLVASGALPARCTAGAAVPLVGRHVPITQLGAINLLGEITGGGDYDALRPHALPITLFGGTFLLLDLPWLIRVKRAAGRPKDLEVVAELEVLQEEIDAQD
jgi:hypothetical protein